jgi:hypothetical protein
VIIIINEMLKKDCRGGVYPRPVRVFLKNQGGDKSRPYIILAIFLRSDE